MKNLECMNSLIVNAEGVEKCRWERAAHGRSNLEHESETIGMTRREWANSWGRGGGIQLIRAGTCAVVETLTCRRPRPCPNSREILRFCIVMTNRYIGQWKTREAARRVRLSCLLFSICTGRTQLRNSSHNSGTKIFCLVMYKTAAAFSAFKLNLARALLNRCNIYIYIYIYRV